MGCGKESDQSDLQATSQSNPAAQQSGQAKAGDPVNVVTGAFTLLETDISILCRHLVLEFSRFYNSQAHFADNTPGSIGRGWTHSFNLRIDLSPDERPIYVDDKGTKILFSVLEDGSYKPPAGSLGFKLSREGKCWLLRQIDGLQAHFNDRGHIVQIVRPGPVKDTTLLLEHDLKDRLVKVTADCGRYVTLTYKGDSALISRIDDHAGRTWEYFYDKHSQLVRVIDPLKRIREYEYGYWSGLVATSRGKTKQSSICGMSKIYPWRLADDQKSDPELSLIYTTDGRVYTQTDALGNITRFDYNRFSRITSVTDSAGWTTIYGYSGVSDKKNKQELLSADDGDAKELQSLFDGKPGDTTKIQKPSGALEEFIFDENGNLIAEIDPIGNTTWYAELYDPSVIKRHSEFGQRTLGNRSDYVTIKSENLKVPYDDNGNRPLIRDPLGNTIRFYDYNMHGKPERIELADGSSVIMKYDTRSGFPTFKCRELQDEQGNVKRIIEECLYDDWGNIVRMTKHIENVGQTNDLSYITDILYDEMGLHPLVQESWIDGKSIDKSVRKENRYEWDELGHLSSLTVIRRNGINDQEELLTTKFHYDLLGRLSSTIEPDGTGVCLERDIEGRLIERFLVEDIASFKTHNDIRQDKRIQQERWKYDNLGRQVAHTAPGGLITTQEWNERGLIEETRDPTGYRTEFSYDRDGNLIKQRTSTGYTINFEYDLAGKVIAKQDNLGFRAAWEYDALGRITKETQFNNDSAAAIEYLHDNCDRWIESRQANGTFEKLVYDAFGNLNHRAQGDWINQKTLRVELFNYDSMGRLESVFAGHPEDVICQFSYEYDEERLSVETKDALGNASYLYFDTEGNVIRKIDARGKVINQQFNKKGLLERRWSDDGTVDGNFKYDSSGRLTAAFEDPTFYEMSYDKNGNLLLHKQKIGEREQSFRFTYDTAGRLTKKHVSKEWWMGFDYYPYSPFVSKIAIPGKTIDLEIDLKGRITEERWNDGGSTVYAYRPDGMIESLESFGSDGNLIFKQSFSFDDCCRPQMENRCFGSEETTYRYSYDQLGQLIQVECQAGDKWEKSRKYVYDPRGNRLEEYRDAMLYKRWLYDEANRIVEARKPDDTIERYNFDACGNLIRKGNYSYHYDTAQRLRQVFLNDADRPDARYSYSPTGERTLIKRLDKNEYTWHDNYQEVIIESPSGRLQAFWGLQVDALLAITPTTEQTARRTFTTSHGSVVGIDLQSDTWDYDPFGNPSSGSFDYPPFYGFHGKRYDRHVTFYHNRARWYEPETGRFTQPDPSGLIDGTNIFRFAKGNPLSYSDSMGLKAEKSSQGQISHESNNNNTISAQLSLNGPLQELSRNQVDFREHAVFVAELAISDFGRSRGVHFSHLNAQLDKAINSNPEFAQKMETMIPGIMEAVSSKGGRSNPVGYTWHHSENIAYAGRAELVPTEVHQSYYHTGSYSHMSQKANER